MSNMKKKALFFGIAFLIICTPFAWSHFQTTREVQEILEQKAHIQGIPVTQLTSVQEEMDIVSIVKNPSEDTIDAFLNQLPNEVPREKVLNVPFLCQNPFQNEAGWKYHDESCEEAAALQVVLSWEKQEITPQEAHEIILDMIAWEKRPEHFGEHKDLYNEDMRTFVRDYFGYNDQDILWLSEVDSDRIKQIIAAGYPLIMAVSGEKIGNPFYPYPGYHMLVVRGYTDNQVITNDNGTKRGEKYPYDWNVFLTANQAVGGGALIIRQKEIPLDFLQKNFYKED